MGSPEQSFDTIEKLRQVRAGKQRTLEEEESRRNVAVQEAVKEAADMAEGNQKLQKNMRKDRSQKRIHEDFVPGFYESELSQERLVASLRASVAEYETKQIPNLENEIQETRQLLEGDENPEEILAEAEAELNGLKEAAEQKRQELKVAGQERTDMDKRHRAFTGQQADIEKDNTGFAVDTVLAQHEKSGQPLELSKEVLSLAVGQELTDRFISRGKTENERHDRVLADGESQNLERAKLDLGELRRTVGQELVKLRNQLSRHPNNEEGIAFWKPIDEKAKIIKDILAEKFYIGKDKKEEAARQKALGIKTEIDSILHQLRQEIEGVVQKCWEFRHKYFQLPLVEGKGVDSSHGVSVSLGLDANNYYRDPGKQKEMDGKRGEVKREFESYLTYVQGQAKELLAEVNRLTPVYPEKLRAGR